MLHIILVVNIINSLQISGSHPSNSEEGVTAVKIGFAYIFKSFQVTTVMSNNHYSLQYADTKRGFMRTVYKIE